MKDLKKFYQNLPKKRMAGGVVFLNSNDEILLVKPTYKDHWEIPGGTTEDNESPLDSARRELKEELNLKNIDLEFICVDYTKAMGDKSESLQFLFYGGRLNETQIAKIKLPKEELSEYRFVSLDQATKLVASATRKNSLPERLGEGLKAIKENKTIYLENGRQAN